ncbi:MAG TPA: hypothetical protein VFL98_01810 [Candidatus Paceibacterota bacterium]|nr:hypothetical protein [Candidatus Paceibacterota bacterium]
MHHDHYHEHGGAGAVLLGMIAGAAAAFALSGYYLYGPNGRRHRRQVDRWLTRARAEILERMEDAADMTEQQYGALVDEITERYGRMKEVGSERAARAAERFKGRWQEMREAAARARRDAEREIAEEDALDEERE